MLPAASSVASSLLVPDLDSENPYDLPRALDRALASFVRLVSVQGGWLAVRRGEIPRSSCPVECASLRRPGSIHRWKYIVSAYEPQPDSHGGSA